MEKPKIRNTLPKRNNGKRNRTAGHNYERLLAKEFREELGDEACLTSRQSSRLLDDCKVDLDCYFANVQAKNVASNINYDKLILEIRDAISKRLPKRLDLPIAVFHKKKRSEVVIMDKSDYYKIMRIYKQYIDDDNKGVAH